MEPGVSMPHSQLLFNNAVQLLVLIPISLRAILIVSSHLHQCLHKGLFPVSLPVKVLKALIPSAIMAT